MNIKTCFYLGLVAAPMVHATSANLRGGSNNNNTLPLGLLEEDNNEHGRALQTLGDWAFCSDSSQCANRCCSSQYSTSDGKLKCTPGGTICVSSTTTKLGDWAFCTSNSQCQNNCCSNQYSTSDGKFKCTPGGTICTGTPNGGLTITSPAITLTTSHVQAGLNKKGDGVTVSQTVVDALNRVTKGYPLYRQLAFVAHTIWESGSYRYKKELNTANYNNYQDCDGGQDGTQPPTNNKQFYGRGYIQLSWCYNYKAYGASRNYYNDPNFFYNQPELLETNEFYAMDSGAWFFETNVKDVSGRFGLTTKDINGALECDAYDNDHYRAKQRYQIFVAIATAVGMTGYSESGCYN